MAVPARQSFEYYNEKPDIQFKEYGRNVENLVRYIVKQEDRETRNRLCGTLIAMVRKLNPNVLHDTEEDLQKFWDHMHLISGLQLDVDGPYPIPEIAILEKKPARLAYHKSEVRFRHYGQNLDLMVAEAIKLEDPAERKQAVVFICRLMKNFYSTWNRDNAEDEIIIKQIEQMSNGKLSISIEEVRNEGLFDGVTMTNNWKPQPMDDARSRFKKRQQSQPGQHAGQGAHQQGQANTGGGHKYNKRKRKY
jgi:hypothetical protein